jgi:uncharacterized repeat protein (TIGR01451 family)
MAPQADLSITNSDNNTVEMAGAPVTYTMLAMNNGPSDAPGAKVVDTFPSSLTCNWTCTGSLGGTCPASGSGSINSSLNLPKGGRANFTATCSVASSATGTLGTTATISAPAGVSDPNSANNSATVSDTLVIRPDVALTMSDGNGMTQIGKVISYVIQITNAGPSDASVTVTDTLPPQLSQASWVCTGSGGASCASKGSGTTINTNATVPVGGTASYVYSATVMSDDAGDSFSNTAYANVTNGSDPNGANNHASDTDTIVVFLSNFEGGSTGTNVVGGVGAASISTQVGVDAGLLGTLGVAPVTVASGQSASGKTLFSVQLMRMGAAIAMRTLTTIDDGPYSDVSEWKVVDLKQHLINLGWRPASARGDDGFLSVGSSSTQMPLVANNSREDLARLQVTTENDIPWVVPVEP